MKRSLAWLLAAVLIASYLMGCGGDTGNSSTPQETSRAESSAQESSQAGEESEEPTSDETVSEVYAWPLTDETVELTVFTKLLPQVEDFETNKTTLWYEEQTGVHINWIQAPSADFTTQLNLTFTNGEYPDVYACELNTDQLIMMRNGGVIEPLDDLIDNYAYYANQVFEEHPEYKDYLRAPDGHIYSLWYNDTGKHMYSTYKMFVKQSWLDQLGIESPKTTGEFEQMLIAFRDNDMNGNGDTTDEIPYMSSLDAWGGSPFYFLVYPWQLQSIRGVYKDDDGVWQLAGIQDNYKEALTWIHHLYEEGLIAEETFTQDKSQFKAILNAGSEEESVVGCFTAAYQGEVIDSTAATLPGDYTVVEPLEGPTGIKQAATNGYGEFKPRCTITTVCENPKIAMQWLDFWISEEGRLIQEYGVEEGVDYEIVDEPSIYGESTSYVRLFNLAAMQNVVWYNHTTPRNDWERIRYGATAEDGSLDTLLYEAALLYEPYYVNTGIPALSWNEDEVAAEEFSTLKADIDEYVKVNSTAFTLGERSLDEWDDYVQEIRDMGLDRYMELVAMTYDGSNVDYQ